MTDHLDDKELLERFRKDSSKQYAFNLIVRKYQERIYWHIRKMVIDHEDANDVTQDSFVKVYIALEKFRGESGLYTWIYRIATNECLNFLKKKRRKQFVSLDDEEIDLANKIEGNFDPVTGDEIQKKLQLALVKLPEKQRLVFNMKYFDDMKYEEISAVLDTSVGALKASYHHAVKKIEEILNGN